MPPVAAQSLSDRLGELHFQEIVVTVAPTQVDIDADEALLTGDSAGDLRRCIDRSNCPDDRLEAAGDGDGNGQVDEHEVDAFEADAASGLTLALGFGGAGFAEFGQAVRAIASIDGAPARQAEVTRFEIEGAEGAIGSTAGIRISFTLRVHFPDVTEGDRHEVRIARAESGLELADRIVLRTAKGWKIQEDSITPVGLQGYYDDGQVAGTQGELEGSEPLTFEIRKGGGLSGWAWFGLLSLLILLVGAGVYAWNRKRRKV